jgi:hypothetical protein
MNKLIEIPMKHIIKKRVTVYKNGKRKFYYINKLLIELFTPEELNIKVNGNGTVTNEELQTYYNKYRKLNLSN